MFANIFWHKTKIIENFMRYVFAMPSEKTKEARRNLFGRRILLPGSMLTVIYPMRQSGGRLAN